MMKLIVGISTALAWFLSSAIGWAQFDFEKPPINYGEVATHDRVAALASAIDKGEIQFNYDARHGWLPDVLKH